MLRCGFAEGNRRFSRRSLSGTCFFCDDATHTPQPDYKKCQNFNETHKFLSFLSPVQTLTISEWFPIAYRAFPIAGERSRLWIGCSRLWIGRSRLWIGRDQLLLGVLGYGLGVPDYLLMLDACLMVHGSWLKAHGSWPREAMGGSWLTLGPQGRAGIWP